MKTYDSFTNNDIKALSIEHLFLIGAHLGHSTKEYFPGNSDFIYGERNGIHVFNLNYTYTQYQRALKFLQKASSSGSSVCFVATDPDIARVVVPIIGKTSTQLGILTRWFPGTLTNWPSIFEFIERVKSNPAIISRQKNPKNWRRWQALKGIKDFARAPDILVFFHAKDHSVAISEALQTNTPSMGILDSNADGSKVTLPILGNDDSLEAQFFYARVFSNALKNEKKSKELISIKKTKKGFDKDLF